MMSDGIIIVAAPSDWLFAKGCLASVRYFLGDIPVTLLIDGDIDTLELERVYGVKILCKADIPDPWLRQYSFGWGVTKMNAIWHSPYERFLHLDADTVVWGNIQEKVFPDNADVGWSFSGVSDLEPVKAYIDNWFFNPKKVSKHFPEFPWHKYWQRFACTGVYSLKRDCIPIEEYKRIMKLSRFDPNLFKFGEMGLLNLMVFRAVDKGQLSIQEKDFQVIFPDHTQETLQKRFSFKNGQPVVVAGDEQVLHMPDNKPLHDNPDCYSEPMTFFRLKYLKDTQGVSGDAAMTCLHEEDADYYRLRVKWLKNEKRKKILGLLRGNFGEWRRLWAKVTGALNR